MYTRARVRAYGIYFMLTSLSSVLVVDKF